MLVLKRVRPSHLIQSQIHGWHLQIWPSRLRHTGRHGSLSGRPKRTQRRCRHPDDTPRCGEKDESRSHLSTNLFQKKHPIVSISCRISWHSTCQYGIKSLFFKICNKYTWHILRAWGLAPIPQGAIHGWLDLHLLKHSMPNPNSWINKLGPWNHQALREVRYQYISICRNQG